MTGTSPQYQHNSRAVGVGAWLALTLIALAAAPPAGAQQKTGPGVPAGDTLTWQGITLYGVIDIGLQYDTHMAPFTPYRPAASGNIVRQNSYQSVFGLTPSNMGQSRVGLQGIEPLPGGDWAAIFQVETFFNPQSGELANSPKSLAVNNGRPLTQQSVGVDGSSAGQAFQTSFVGVKSERFGALTFGRQVTLLSEGMIKYDPNYLSTAFGLLGASNTYAGGGSNEDNRLDQMIKYVLAPGALHAGALYKLNGSSGSARTAVQANLGAGFDGASVDAYYSSVKSSITMSALNATQVAALTPAFDVTNSLAGTVSDNTAYALMASYKIDPVKLFAGYEYIKYQNPDTPLNPGFVNIGGYVLAVVTNNAYIDPKVNHVYWTGVRYAVIPQLELTGAWYYVQQNAYGTKSQAGCTTSAHSTCSGTLEAFSFDADYRFNVHFDVYAGAMYSAVHDGLAAGYINTNNINPTVGVRYKF